MSVRNIMSFSYFSCGLMIIWMNKEFKKRINFLRRHTVKLVYKTIKINLSSHLISKHNVIYRDVLMMCHQDSYEVKYDQWQSSISTLSDANHFAVNVNRKHGLTGCISSAPVHYTWTSGSDGRPPAPEEPSRFPLPFRPRSGCLGRRAPCPTWDNQILYVIYTAGH